MDVGFVEFSIQIILRNLEVKLIFRVCCLQSGLSLYQKGLKERPVDTLAVMKSCCIECRTECRSVVLATIPIEFFVVFVIPVGSVTYPATDSGWVREGVFEYSKNEETHFCL